MTLRLPNNSIRNFTAVLDDTVEGPLDEDDGRFETIDINDEGQLTTTSTRTNCSEGTFSLQLNNNLLEELPVNIVASSRLKNLQLSGESLIFKNVMLQMH